MFVHTCSACSARRLVFPSQLRGVVNTADGIEVRFECWCGSEQSWQTGRNVRQPARAA